MSKLKNIITELESGEHICIVDFETNGFSPTDSVLEIAAIKVDRELNIVSSLNRYYFPRERYNPHAIKVNKLTERNLIRKRAGSSYPDNFLFDSEVVEFFEDMKLFIAHNVDFDKKFLPIDIRNLNSFCTMKYHTNILKIPQKRRRTYKYPKLEEVCNYYEIDFNQAEAHSGIYDVTKTFEIVKALLKT